MWVLLGLIIPGIVAWQSKYRVSQITCSLLVNRKIKVMQDWLNKGLSLLYKLISLLYKYIPFLNFNKICLHHVQYVRQDYFYNGNTYFYDVSRSYTSWFKFIFITASFFIKNLTGLTLQCVKVCNYTIFYLIYFLHFWTFWPVK